MFEKSGVGLHKFHCISPYMVQMTNFHLGVFSPGKKQCDLLFLCW